MLIYYFLKVVSYQSLGLCTRLGVVATKSSIGPHPRCRPVLSCQFVHLSRRVRRPNDCSARKRNRLETVRVIFKAAVSRPNRPGPSSDLFVVVDTRSRSKRATSFANGKRRKRVISVWTRPTSFFICLISFTAEPLRTLSGTTGTPSVCAKDVPARFFLCNFLPMPLPALPLRARWRYRPWRPVWWTGPVRRS